MKIRVMLLAIMICPAAWAEPNGQLLASQCFQCHGFNGRSLGEIDSLAGRATESLYGDLKDFQTNGKNDIMSKQARLYNDAELKAIAAYFNSLGQ